MKVLKKVANFFGYTLTRKHKTESLIDLIKLRLIINPCDYLIDVGANMGDFSYNYRQMFNNLICFEPNHNLISILNQKFKNNNNIKIFNLGVGDRKESRNFYITNDKGKTLSSIKKQNNIIHKLLKNTRIVDQYNINVITLHDFIIENNLQEKSIFLKIDTQGNDLEVLHGLKKFIKNIKFIKIEMPVINIYDISYNFLQINEFMDQNNFIPLYIEHITRDKSGRLVEYDVVFERKI